MTSLLMIPAVILNLTQHDATPAQKEQHVIDPPESLRNSLRARLTFEDLPDQVEVLARARDIARTATQWRDHITKQIAETAMIGGAPYLMPALATELRRVGLCPLAAFSKRVSKETVQDGKTVKVAVFEHLGFVEVVA